MNRVASRPWLCLAGKSHGKKKKKSKKQNTKKLLAFHQCLVEEKGPPPAGRLMLQHAATTSKESVPKYKELENCLQCDMCDFKAKSDHVLKVHKWRQHRDSSMPEELRTESWKSPLDISFLSEERDENISNQMVNSPLKAEEDIIIDHIAKFNGPIHCTSR